LKQNKGNLENPIRIAKKNQSGGIRVGLCRVETSSQKILMIGNLSTITGTNQNCLRVKRTFFEKTSLKEKKNIIAKKKKVHINKTEQISAIFNYFHRHCLLKSTAWNYRQNPLEIFLHALQTSFLLHSNTNSDLFGNILSPQYTIHFQ
jgi:hypothetical protein